MALGTATFTATTNPLVMPADWDSTKTVDILVTSCGGTGATGGLAGGIGGGGGGFARWNGVTITNQSLCAIEFIPGAGPHNDVKFTDENGMIRYVRGGRDGSGGGDGGFEYASDFTPAASKTGGYGGFSGAPATGGGGGGEAASEAADGNFGIDGGIPNGGAGGTGGAGADGGAGGNNGQVGIAGSNYGGGGGGGGAGHAGGAGAGGKVEIIYTKLISLPPEDDGFSGGFDN